MSTSSCGFDILTSVVNLGLIKHILGLKEIWLIKVEHILSVLVSKVRILALLIEGIQYFSNFASNSLKVK